MKIDDQKAFLDLAKSLDYEVSGIGAGNGMMPGMAQNALAQNPDGSVTATETTVITFVKRTTYPAK